MVFLASIAIALVYIKGLGARTFGDER
jgi:hypothetical protein